MQGFRGKEKIFRKRRISKYILFKNTCYSACTNCRFKNSNHDSNALLELITNSMNLESLDRHDRLEDRYRLSVDNPRVNKRSEIKGGEQNLEQRCVWAQQQDRRQGASRKLFKRRNRKILNMQPSYPLRCKWRYILAPCETRLRRGNVSERWSVSVC